MVCCCCLNIVLLPPPLFLCPRPECREVRGGVGMGVCKSGSNDPPPPAPLANLFYSTPE